MALPSGMKTLPASWFTSQNLYDLECRAVFDQAWYLLGAVPKFQENPSLDFEFAGVKIRVVHDGDEEFSVQRVADSVPVRHYLTPTGLLFGTISPNAPSFEEWFPDSLLPLLNAHDFRRLSWRHSLSYPGLFNWKTMVDGYQECLHCAYTHRSFSIKYPPTFYEVRNYGTYSQHIADPTKPNDGLFLYFFPICTLNLYGGGMSSFRVCPGNGLEHGGRGQVGETRMEFDYYYDDGTESGMEGWDEYFKFVRRVAMEDFELCETAQANLQKGVYSQGILNEVKERGVVHYQQMTRRMVSERWKKETAERERAEGPVWPKLEATLSERQTVLA
jgi:phenylpropionate dioxygenase-like ring-hydroxylating dioxygenase large terminal subunit